MVERVWVRCQDAKHLAWGDAPTETVCGVPLVRRYSIAEANCEDCRIAFQLTTFNVLGSHDALFPVSETHRTTEGK